MPLSDYAPGPPLQIGPSVPLKLHLRSSLEKLSMHYSINLLAQAAHRGPCRRPTAHFSRLGMRCGFLRKTPCKLFHLVILSLGWFEKWCLRDQADHLFHIPR